MGDHVESGLAQEQLTSLARYRTAASKDHHRPWSLVSMLSALRSLPAHDVVLEFEHDPASSA